MRVAGTVGAEWYRLLLRGAAERIYERTAVLWGEDSATEGLFLIDAGAVRLTRKVIGDRQIVVGEKPSPTAIITPGLFDGGLNCTTAKAMTNCVVHVLPRSRLIRLCHESPDLLLKLIVPFSGRDRRAADFMDLVMIGSVRQRVARLLLDVARQ